MTSSRLARKRIILWRGTHGDVARELITQCWHNNDLLICLPPNLSDFSFVAALPPGDIVTIGNNVKELADCDKRVLAPYWYNEMRHDPVLGVFTSGTIQGHPKLVLYSKDNVLDCQNAIFSLYDLNRIKSLWCYPQPYHVFGLLLGYISSIDRGWVLKFAEGGYSSAHHHRWHATVDATTLSLFTPVHLRDLVTYTQTINCSPSFSYSCIIGGAAVSLNDWNAARAVLQIEAPSIGYGCSEASPGISHLGPGLQPNGDGDIGYVLAGGSLVSELYHLTFTAPWIAMATIEQGQLNIPESVLIREDLQQTKDGRLRFTSRRDLILNRGGEKFALERIEAYLAEHLRYQAICVPVAEQRLGHELGIVLASSPLEPRKRGQIFAELKQEFGRSFNPDLLVTVVELPVSPQGKLDRKAAAALFESNQR